MLSLFPPSSNSTGHTAPGRTNSVGGACIRRCRRPYTPLPPVRRTPCTSSVLSSLPCRRNLPLRHVRPKSVSAVNLKQQAGQDGWNRAHEEDSECNQASASEQLCPRLLRCLHPGWYKSSQQ